MEEQVMRMMVAFQFFEGAGNETVVTSNVNNVTVTAVTMPTYKY
jgi:hypothetical protein